MLYYSLIYSNKNVQALTNLVISHYYFVRIKYNPAKSKTSHGFYGFNIGHLNNFSV